MSDLAERLRQIERNPSPDLWAEIVDRQGRPNAPEPPRRVRHRIAAGLVAAVVAVGALAFLFSVFQSEDGANTTGSARTPIKIKVWYGEVPHIEASYEGVEIPLDSIETPGSELELPRTVAPMELPTGTPIVIESLNYAETASVFRLELASGELIADGSCIVPGALRVLPGPGTSAFFIFVEWPVGSGGMGFRAETVGEEVDHDSALDPDSTVDARKLGLATCNAGAAAPQVSTTYLLSEFTIDHPANGDPDAAIVGYAATWVPDHYPGEGECTVVLYDKAGAEVGRTEFGFGGERRTSSATTGRFPVAGAPVDVAGWCVGDPNDPSNFGQGYRFTHPRVIQSDQIDGIEIEFTVSWIGDNSPGMRTCTLEVDLVDGGHRRIRGGIDIGEPELRTRYLVEGLAPSDVRTVDVSCHPPSGGD